MNLLRQRNVTRDLDLGVLGGLVKVNVESKPGQPSSQRDVRVSVFGQRVY